MASTLLAGVGSSGHAEGTTQSAVAEGTITVRDQANQTQDVSTLSRDTANANDSISPIFDKEKEQKRLQTAQMIGEISTQVADIARTQGEIVGTKAQKDPAALQAAKEALAAKGNLTPTADQIADQAYNTAMAPYGTGSSLQRGIQAATAAVQGLAGGNLAAAIAGASAPYLASIIHDKTTTRDENGNEVVNTTANLMAHAVLGAVVAAASGNNGLSGAAGAVAGEYIAQQLYPGIDRADLSEEQRQTISTLSTLAAGLAGGIAGGDTGSAVAGAQAGKNAVENNALCSTVTCLNDPFDLSKPTVGGAGMAAAGAGAAVGAAIADALNGDKDSDESAPKMSDEDKAELGGAGSGTPGGWGPDDEEDGRNSDAQNSGKDKDTQIWTETKKDDPVSNAYEHWEKHKAEFPELQNSKQYVDATHDFVNNPPEGTLTKTRPNGDTLYYNPETNTFASKNVNGVPRTMFRPTNGMEYWNKQ